MTFSNLIERALRVAATAHEGQYRKGSRLPYITHPVAVMLILEQAGFTDPHLLAAALLHDVVEDTVYTAGQLAAEFPAPIPEYVAALTERKHDADGAPRSWRNRKEEHLVHVAAAPLPARAIALADKLHNLSTILYDLEQGDSLAARDAIWSRFNAPRADLSWYYRFMIAAAEGSSPELAGLAADCHTLLAKLGLQ